MLRLHQDVLHLFAGAGSQTRQLPTSLGSVSIGALPNSSASGEHHRGQLTKRTKSYAKARDADERDGSGCGEMSI